MKKTIATIGIGAVAISMSIIEVSAMEKGTINTSALNIRRGPSTDYNRVDKVYQGNIVEILEKSNGWYKVRLSNGVIGWGSSQYIIVNGQQTSSSTPKPDQNKRGKVTAGSRLNIRSRAGSDHQIIGKANYGEIVDILEKNGGWYKLKLSNGVIGWGSSQYIVETTQPPSENNNVQKPPISIEGKRGKIIASPRLNIRSGAGSNYQIIEKVNYGDVVNLLEKSSGWYKVKLSNGTVGWGSSQYIVETTQENVDPKPPVEQERPDTPKPPIATNRETVVNLAYNLLGKSYSWGAEGPDSFDCSGFTKYVYSKAEGKNIPRVSRDQAKHGVEVSRDNFASGDLVYFDTDGDGRVNHIGVYVGGNEFIHASGTPTNPDSVRKDNLGATYWSKVLLGARRF